MVTMCSLVPLTIHFNRPPPRSRNRIVCSRTRTRTTTRRQGLLLPSGRFRHEPAEASEPVPAKTEHPQRAMPQKSKAGRLADFNRARRLGRIQCLQFDNDSPVLPAPQSMRQIRLRLIAGGLNQHGPPNPVRRQKSRRGKVGGERNRTIVEPPWRGETAFAPSVRIKQKSGWSFRGESRPLQEQRSMPKRSEDGRNIHKRREGAYPDARGWTRDCIVKRDWTIPPKERYTPTQSQPAPHPLRGFAWGTTRERLW